MSKETEASGATQLAIDLIPKEKVSLLKIKIGKGHRKESDWDEIKEILYSHDLFTALPEGRMAGIFSIDNILCADNALILFTNADDCGKYLHDILEEQKGEGNYFQLGTVSLSYVIEVAKKAGKNIYIDIQKDINQKFLVYEYETGLIKVTILGRG